MHTRATAPIVLRLTLLLTATALSGAATAQELNIVDGDLTPASEQQRLGLVRVGSGCSGALINRFWVLTAHHCVGNGPAHSFPFDQRQISAVWSDRVATPTRYVRYRETHGVDVALVFLGAGDLGPVNTQRLLPGQPFTGARLMKYGTGIHAFATRSGSPPVDVPAQRDGRYRNGEFHVGQSQASWYTLKPNSAGQIANAGDSGGPDFMITDDGNTLGISGVSSAGFITGCLPGRSCGGISGYTWVTAIGYTLSAPIFGARAHIQNTALEGVIPCRGVAAACTVSEMTHLLVLP